MQLSIILPTLNEAEHLNEVLDDLQHFREKGHQLIIVDGGSADDTLMIAQSMIEQQRVDHVLVSKKGRALQMNAGAEVATGDVLLFLHADTRLPHCADDVLSKAFEQISQANKFWGRFDVRLSGNKWGFRVIETFINLRSRMTSIATGDQAIFVESSLFRQIDAYPEIALMEDVAISQRLKKVSSPVCLSEKVITSSRRWETRGIIATVFLMWKIRFLYFMGVSPTRLVKMYR